MTLDDLIFIGLRGYAVALHRDTGEIVWSNNDLKNGYTTLLLDGDRLIVSTNGYIYCLHPLTGQILWHNPMKGYGVGTTAMVSVRGSSDQTITSHEEDADDSRRSSDSSASSSSTT